MTAEIVIMNSEAIAMASDSAVTMVTPKGEKIFTSANKLFALSKYRPVGVMVYGRASFMQTPWETIIKVYRRHLGKKGFPLLEDYAKDFMNFLDDGNKLFPDVVQERFVSMMTRGYFDLILRDIKDEYTTRIDDKGEISEKELKKIIGDIISKHHDMCRKAPKDKNFGRGFSSRFKSKYLEIVKSAAKSVFQKVPLTKTRRNQLYHLAECLVSRSPQHFGEQEPSGLVFAGFGEKEVFPSVTAYIVLGIVDDKLKAKQFTSEKIDFNTSASVMPFAQREMVDTFMAGVNPKYAELHQSYLMEAFSTYARMIVNNIEEYTDKEKEALFNKLTRTNQEILTEMKKKLDSYMLEAHIEPITSVVAMLPKDELAAMAESLVNLTSFKRKVTMESETVGEPIDVAVISKGDGFVWIKRKHYFPAELNQQFFRNYQSEA